MANTKITQHVIANNAIQEAMISNAAVTPDKLHGTLDLSSKTLTLPSAAVATTQSQSDGSTKIATTSYVDTAVSNLVDSSPSSLNTLNELAAALNDDASFSTTVTNSIATKLPLAGGTLTGALTLSGAPTSALHATTKTYVDTADALKLNLAGGTLTGDLIINSTGALKVPVGTTGQRPTAATGQLRYNSTDGALEIYNGSAWTGVGTSGSNKVLDTFTGNGSTTAFTLSVTPANEDALLVFIDGVYQEKGDYSLSNAVLTLDTAPASGEKIAVHTTTASVHDGTSALTQQFTGDDSTTAFTLSQDPKSENNTQVYINGVYQQKTDYTVSGTTLTLDSAPLAGDIIEVNMFTVATLGNSDTVTEGVSNLYHTSARAISAVSAGNLTGLTVDTNTLSVDATNNRVGIGTTSPNASFHIGFNQSNVGTSANPAIQIGGTSTYRLGLYTDAEGGIIQNLNGDDGLQFRVKTAGEAMRIDGGTGNVGIGTSSPSRQLTVQNTISNSGGVIGLTSSDSSTSGTCGIIHFGNSTDSSLASINGIADGATDAGALLFKTEATGAAIEERMRISSTGKTSWSAGNIGSVATQARDFTFYTEGSTNGVAIHSNDHRIIFMGAGGSSGAASDVGYLQLEKEGSAKVVFNANGESYIDNDGNTGIGISAPVAKLHIRGATQNSYGQLYVVGGPAANQDPQIAMGSSTNGRGFYIDDSDTNRFKIYTGHGKGASSGAYEFSLDNSGTIESPRTYANTTGSYSANVYVHTDGSFNRATSSRRYKKDIVDATKGLDEILQLKPRNYKPKNERTDSTELNAEVNDPHLDAEERTFAGLIAEEVHDLGLSEYVDYEADGTTPSGLYYGNMVALLVKGIQEQQTIINDLKARIETLEG